MKGAIEKIGPNTAISLGILLPILGGLATLMLFQFEQRSEQSAIRSEAASFQQDVLNEFEKFNDRLDRIESNMYTKPEAEIHALRMQLLNPDVMVPDVYDPTEVLRPGVRDSDVGPRP